MRTLDPSLNHRSFEQGTKLFFPQATAPIGWTKSTDHDDKAIRIVSGTPSSGGSVAFSTVFGITATDSHTLTVSEMPAHTHPGTYYDEAGGGQSSIVATNNGNTSVSGAVISQGGGGGHTHGIDLQVNYVDTMIAVKD